MRGRIVVRVLFDLSGKEYGIQLPHLKLRYRSRFSISFYVRMKLSCCPVSIRVGFKKLKYFVTIMQKGVYSFQGNQSFLIAVSGLGLIFCESNYIILRIVF